MQARFVGSRLFSVTDDRAGVSFPTWVLYPTQVPSGPVAFGPYSMEVRPDAPVDEGRFPLVVISHGSGSSPLLFRTLGCHLARHGYVIALPEHPGNNRNDNTLADTHENLVNRPRHLRLVLEAVSMDPQLGPRVWAERAAVIGHSMGAYTALAVAGGTPWSRTGQRIEVEADRRVKSLVLLAPAAPWYVPDQSLLEVVAPILMLGGEQDVITPSWHAHLVLAQVPDRARVTYRVVERAGHYSFLSPFPPEMKRARLPPAMDPEGFDRESFHERLNAEVLEFLDRTL